MKKIVTLASFNMDIVLPMKVHPKPGETLHGGDISYVPGGKGLNQVVALSRMGAHVHAVARVGTDAFGDSMSRFVRSQKGVKLDVEALPRSSGAALIMIDRTGQNMIGVGSGPNMDIPVSAVSKIKINKGDIALATLEVPQKATLALFKKAKAAGCITILNTAPGLPLIPGLLTYTDFFIANETELTSYTEKKFNPKNPESAAIAATDVLRKHPHLHVIATLGGAGVVYVQKGIKIIVRGHKVPVVDTTGAGDCFVGSFAAALLEGETISKALVFANAAAALSVEKLGASASIPKKFEVVRFLKKNKR